MRQATRQVRVFEANVSSQTDPAVQAQAALRVVLVRATGARDAANDPALAQVLAQAQTYVLGTRPAGTGSAITVMFDGAALERDILAAGRTVWPGERPVLLVILTGGPASGAFETRRQVEGALDAAGNRRGQPITVARPEALNLPTTGDISAGGGARGRTALARRRRARGIRRRRRQWRNLALVAERAGSQREPGMARSKRACMARPTYSCAMRFLTRRCPKSPILVEIEGVPTLKEYARAAEMLAEAPGVRGVQLAEAAGSRATFAVLTRGGVDALADVARRQRATGTNGSHGRRQSRISPASVADRAMLRHLPNFICLVRIALIWPTIDALYAGHYWTALILVAVCAVSDGLDGWLAKRFNWTSHLGKILDPLADKLLLVALFLTAAWMNLLPWWLTAIVVARDVMIGCRRGHLPLLVRAAARPAHHAFQDQHRHAARGRAGRDPRRRVGPAHARDGDRARHRDDAHHHRLGRRLSIRLHAARARDLSPEFRCDS